MLILRYCLPPLVFPKAINLGCDITSMCVHTRHCTISTCRLKFTPCLHQRNMQPKHLGSNNHKLFFFLASSFSSVRGYHLPLKYSIKVDKEGAKLVKPTSLHKWPLARTSLIRSMMRCQPPPPIDIEHAN